MQNKSGQKSQLFLPDLSLTVLGPLCLLKPVFLSRTTHPLQEDVSLSEFAHCCECVLHNAHDRAITLGSDNHAWHHGKLLDLCPSLQRLWQVQVHLIPIEVSIIRSCHTVVKRGKSELGKYLQ